MGQILAFEVLNPLDYLLLSYKTSVEVTESQIHVKAKGGSNDYLIIEKKKRKKRGSTAKAFISFQRKIILRCTIPHTWLYFFIFYYFYPSTSMVMLLSRRPDLKMVLLYCQEIFAGIHCLLMGSTWIWSRIERRDCDHYFWDQLINVVAQALFEPLPLVVQGPSGYTLFPHFSGCVIYNGSGPLGQLKNAYSKLGLQLSTECAWGWAWAKFYEENPLDAYDVFQGVISNLVGKKWYSSNYFIIFFIQD